MEFLYEYGLFLAKAITLVIAIVAIVMVIASSAMKPAGKKGELELNDLSEEFIDVEEDIIHYLLSKEELKEKDKKDKKA
ncbi:protease SohB, partial [Colwellia sp. BRX8-7]|nr:protease SohB [Colwellia sp. BRX8-7]